MINCENMTTEINGNISELFVEYTLITRTLYEKLAESYGKDKAKRKVERAYSLGIMSEEELDAETNALVKDVEKLVKLADAMSKTFH